LYGPAPETGGGLLLCGDASERLLQFVETVASTCQQFVYELETIGQNRDMCPLPPKPAQFRRSGWSRIERTNLIDSTNAYGGLTSERQRLIRREP
jgi:hypothetical protein